MCVFPFLQSAHCLPHLWAAQFVAEEERLAIKDLGNTAKSTKLGKGNTDSLPCAFTEASIWNFKIASKIPNSLVKPYFSGAFWMA